MASVCDELYSLNCPKSPLPIFFHVATTTRYTQKSWMWPETGKEGSLLFFQMQYYMKAGNGDYEGTIEASDELNDHVYTICMYWYRLFVLLCHTCI